MGMPRDFTEPDIVPSLVEWLWSEHRVGVVVCAAYVLAKCAARTWRPRGTAMAEYSSDVWDPVCLAHNALSVCVGAYSLATWPRSLGAADACPSATGGAALVILLQLAHCLSDFVVFLPQMAADPVFVAHHGVLCLVSAVLPHCPGCYYVVAAFAIAEFGSGAIGADAEWRRRGRPSRGLKRVVVFGVSRAVNLALLREIWRVTPTVHEFSLTDATDGSLVFKVNAPVCLVTSLGGSLMMLAVNGLTWWRMFKSYRKHRARRLSPKGA